MDQRQHIIQLLGQAQHYDPSVREPAEAKLKDLQQVSGFKLCLYQIATANQVPNDQRVLAAILLKSIADKVWRRKGVQPDTEEKEQIKSLLLQNLGEPNEKLSSQLALVIATCARWDWPRNWPALFPAIFQALGSTNELVVLRSLAALRQVLKVLANKRLAPARRQFEEVSTELLGRLCAMWMAKTSELLNRLQSEQLTPETTVALMRTADFCRLYVKCILCIIQNGIQNIDVNADAVRFFPALLEALKAMCGARAKLGEDNVLKDVVSKLVKGMVKTAIGAQNEHPLQFRKQLMPFMEFFNSVLQGSFHNGEFVFEKLTVQALTFFSRVVGCRAYSAKPGLMRTAIFSAGGGIQFNEQASNEAKMMLANVLSDQYVSNLVRMLITEFFPLRVSDLQQWESDPECYIEEDQLSLSNDKIRPAAENLFTNLLNHKPAVVGRVCVELLFQALKTSPPSPVAPAVGSPEYRNLLMKEAVFFAVGSGGTELADIFEQHNCPFGQWFQQFLQQELSTTEPLLKITRRRGVWIISQWVRLVPDQYRPGIYGAIAHLLQDNDIVVRLAAATCLQSLVEDMGFETTVEQFIPVLSQLTDQLFNLMGQVETLDMKNQVMCVIRAVVETLGPKIYPAIPSLVNALPKLWETCQSENLLKNSILTTLTGLVRALKAESVKMHGFIIPVLATCTTDTQAQDKLFLVESAFDLMHATLQNATQLTPELLALFSNWLNYHMHTTEHLEVTIPILESYILLGGVPFMTTHASNLAQVCQSLCSRVRDEGVEMICKVLETCCQLFPKEFPSAFGQFISMIVTDIGESSNKENKNAKKDTCIVAYLMILSRLLFQNFEIIAQFLASKSGGNNNFLGGLLDLMMDKLDCMAESYKKKLVCLAMCTCLQINDQAILQRMPGILGCCSIALSDCKDESPPLYPEIDSIPDNLRTEEERIKLMVRCDPANHAHLGKFVMEKVMQCKQNIGDQAFDGLMSTVDPFIIQEIQKYA